MKHDAVVTKVRREAPNISTIFFTIDGGVFPFTAGQYISVYFADASVKSGKAYSLSSAPRDSALSITVKNIGEYSGKLCALKPGDHLTVSSPFGFFNVNDDAPIVAIAAGVGISPIWSIIRDELSLQAERAVTLHLTAPTASELVFRERIEALSQAHTNMWHRLYVTREEAPGVEHRRFTVQGDITTDQNASAQFYVCGSESFTRSIWRQLMESGVDESRIVTETFFESTL